MKNSGIYMWTSPSGKKYIGQSKDLYSRKLNFLRFDKPYTTTTSAIDNARKKYNHKEDWKYKILEYCNVGLLNDREIYWMNFYNTLYDGYNSRNGGSGSEMPHRHKHSEETKRKISESNKGQKRSKETCRKIGEKSKGRPAWNKGKSGYMTEEQKIHHSLVHLGNHSAKRKPIDVFDSYGNYIGTYESARKVSSILDIGWKGISRVVTGSSKTYKGYTFRYANTKEEKADEKDA